MPLTSCLVHKIWFKFIVYYFKNKKLPGYLPGYLLPSQSITYYFIFHLRTTHWLTRKLVKGLLTLSYPSLCLAENTMRFIGRRVFVICFVFVSCTFPEKYGPVYIRFPQDQNYGIMITHPTGPSIPPVPWKRFSLTRTASWMRWYVGDGFRGGGRERFSRQVWWMSFPSQGYFTAMFSVNANGIVDETISRDGLWEEGGREKDGWQSFTRQVWWMISPARVYFRAKV